MKIKLKNLNIVKYVVRFFVKKIELDFVENVIENQIDNYLYPYFLI